jgi:hypothetical protein
MRIGLRKDGRLLCCIAARFDDDAVTTCREALARVQVSQDIGTNSGA